MIDKSMGYTCNDCGMFIYSLQQHSCNSYYKQYPYSFPTLSTFSYNKPLPSYSLQELLDELKRRKNAQDAKVKELEKEVELQKQLDAMFPEEK